MKKTKTLKRNIGRQKMKTESLKSKSGSLKMKTGSVKGKSGSLPKTRKSKRLAQSTEKGPLVIASDSSSDSWKETCNVDIEQTSTVHLGSYEKCVVIGERIVAVKDFNDSMIPNVIKTSGLEPICTIKGRVNLTMVREFFAGIDGSTLVSIVRGKRIVLTADGFAKFGKFDRPLPEEPHWPYRKGEKRPSWKEIWPTMCEKGCEPTDQDKIYLRDLTREFLILHHMFWWNVNPKPPRRMINKEQAAMLYAIYNGRKPDIAMLWWGCVYATYANGNSIASLPLGILLTNLMMNEHKVQAYGEDDWQKQKRPLGRETIGKSQGQSKLHRRMKTPNLGTVEGNNDMLRTIHEVITDTLDLLEIMDKRQQRMEKRQKRIDKKLGLLEDIQMKVKGKAKAVASATGEDSTDMDDEDEDDSSGDDDSGGDDDEVYSGG